MKNYINSRIQAYNNLKINGALEHTLRIVDSRNAQNHKPNYVYDIETKQQIKVVYLKKKQLEQLPPDKQQQYLSDRKILLDYYNNLKDRYLKDRSEHNELFKERRKKNIKDDCGSWGEGVFTFSEKIENDWKTGKLNVNDLFKIALNCAKETCEYMDADLKNIVVHLDEKNIHFQYFYKNFDDMGRSCTHSDNLLKKGKSKEFLQDIAAKHFGALGIERGLSKEVTGVTRHQKTAEYYSKLLHSKNLEVKEMNNILANKSQQLETLDSSLLDLDLQINKIKEDKILIDLEIKDSKSLRDNIKNDINLSKNEKKGLYEDISKQQQKLRDLRKVYQNKENEIVSFKKQMQKDTISILQGSKKLIGFDEDKLKKSIYLKLQEYSKFKVKFTEINNLQKQLQDTQNKLKTMVIYNDKLTKALENANVLDKEKSDLIKEYMAREKQDKSFTNSEVATVTKKFVNEINDLKLALKKEKQNVYNLDKQIENYKDFVSDQGLENDFNEYSSSSKKHHHRI